MKKPKDKKQIIDSIIELKDGPGSKMGRSRNGGLGSQVQKDVSDILADVSPNVALLNANAADACGSNIFFLLPVLLCVC